MKKQILLGIATLAFTFTLHAPLLAASSDDIPAIELSKYRTTEALLLDWADRLDSEFVILTEGFEKHPKHLPPSESAAYLRNYPRNSLKAVNYADEQELILIKKEFTLPFYDEAKRELAQHGGVFTAQTVPERYKQKVIKWAENYLVYYYSVLGDKTASEEKKNATIKTGQETLNRILNNVFDSSKTYEILHNIETVKLAEYDVKMDIKPLYALFDEIEKCKTKKSLTDKILKVNVFFQGQANLFITKTFPLNDYFSNFYTNITIPDLSKTTGFKIIVN